MTVEEARAEFLKHVANMADYWLKTSGATTCREKLNGLAFSILAAIDGSAAALPGFELKAVLGDHKFPRRDIGEGRLHEEWHKYEPKG